MHRFERKLITEWRRLKLPSADATVVAAVSGGADSVSLLRAIHAAKIEGKLNFRLVAAHINHQLRGEQSDEDEKFVRQFTASLDIELAVRRIAVASDGNLEQNARRARYEALRDIGVGVKATMIATGHTLDDQAETFLMNLIRGSGVAGLSGMRAVRPFRVERDDERPVELDSFDDQPELPIPQVLLVRPLLMWARRMATEQYCADQGIEFRRDPMNEDIAFKRVRIRRVLLPLLEDMNPNIVEIVAATAERLSHIPIEEPMIDVGETLSLSELRDAESPAVTATIRSWLTARRGDLRRITSKHIAAIEHLARSTRSGRVAEIPGGRVVKSGGRLSYEVKKVEKPAADN